jgi:hypothetical protein
MNSHYKQHVVNTGNFQLHFKEVESLFDISEIGTTISGTADTITDFVLSLNLEKNWFPYGYGLRYVVRQKNSKSITAVLTRNPAQ